MWKIKRPESETVEDAVNEFEVNEQPPAEVVSLHPQSNERDATLLQMRMAIHQGLLDRINLSMLDKLPEEQIKAEIAQVVPELLVTFDQPLNREERANLVDEVMDELLGLGPLEPLLKDEGITDILVNGAETVFVERQGVLQRMATRFQDEKHLMRIIDKIVSRLPHSFCKRTETPFVAAKQEKREKEKASPWHPTKSPRSR